MNRCSRNDMAATAIFRARALHRDKARRDRASGNGDGQRAGDERFDSSPFARAGPCPLADATPVHEAPRHDRDSREGWDSLRVAGCIGERCQGPESEDRMTEGLPDFLFIQADELIPQALSEPRRAVLESIHPVPVRDTTPAHHVRGRSTPLRPRPPFPRPGGTQRKTDSVPELDAARPCRAIRGGAVKLGWGAVIARSRRLVPVAGMDGARRRPTTPGGAAGGTTDARPRTAPCASGIVHRPAGRVADHGDSGMRRCAGTQPTSTR